MKLEYFHNILRSIGTVSAIIAGVFLVGIMALTVVVVVTRPFGLVITGSYELVSLMITVTVAFGLGYSALKRVHVVIYILISRLSQRTQAILESFTSFLGMVICAVIAWENIGFTYKRALLGEATDVYGVSLIPFRCIFIFGMFFWCSVFLFYLFKALKQAVNK